ncbi:hypothetical protein [Anditalea andensis]|uniref:Uncharacterized protein n=1 Tax=Anditalea andensis TaxID=1048983 RepID=A0A074LKW3_9BACT|nr:hypothetical protein [Anditalea andensis]KEO74482.1 hypothetical protein EL17_07015 [Anditalea andensis]
MIHCKPKSSTYFSLLIVIGILFAGLVYIILDYSRYQTYNFWFYLFSASLLTVVLLVILVKMMAGYRFISAGKESFFVKIPLRGWKNEYRLNEVLAWQEEKIIANKKEFKQLTMVFSDKTSFSMSNHEHTHYEDLVGYLQKKLPKKKIKTS